jgi:hypothetical protein
MEVQDLASIPVKILFKREIIDAELTRITAPRTVRMLVDRLPLEGPAVFANGQAYFKVNLKLGLEKPRREAQAGTIGYWPLGDAICIYLRDTKTYSPVNMIGRTVSDPDCLKEGEVGSIIRVEKS